MMGTCQAFGRQLLMITNNTFRKVNHGDTKIYNIHRTINTNHSDNKYVTKWIRYDMNRKI